jgi:hypothetical protein
VVERDRRTVVVQDTGDLDMTDKTASKPDDMELVSIDGLLGGEFQMERVTGESMATGAWLTIHALQDDLDGTDLATARLAYEVAERIDSDGKECGISLYNRLHSLLLDLQHNERTLKCPMAQRVTATE